MSLQDKIELVGQWKVEGTRVVADEVCEEIERLTTSRLKQLAVSKEWGAWETLFVDSVDGRFWERTYPDGHLQGGGPPRLGVISEDEARRKYTF